MAYADDCQTLNRVLFGDGAESITERPRRDMHPLGKELFSGLRFQAWKDATGLNAPSHGGTRMIDLQQSKRTGEDTLSDIKREAVEHAAVIADFHRVFYSSRNTHGFTFYEGVPTLKNPMDLWVLQEILWDLQPTLVIETGTAYGGSALYIARQMDRRKCGRVISIDMDPATTLPEHDRISYVKGSSSTHWQVVQAVRNVAKDHPRVMVMLDSDHSAKHVTDELDAYADLVTPLQFLIVEDTNINGRPVEIDWHGGPGPGPAVDGWLPEHPEFERAWMAERFLLTHNPGGWLRRMR